MENEDEGTFSHIRVAAILNADQFVWVPNTCFEMISNDFVVVVKWEQKNSARESTSAVIIEAAAAVAAFFSFNFFPFPHSSVKYLLILW